MKYIYPFCNSYRARGRDSFILYAESTFCQIHLQLLCVQNYKAELSFPDKKSKFQQRRSMPAVVLLLCWESH